MIAPLIAACRSGWSLPQPFYASEEVLVKDIERVFMRQWLYVGTTAQIKNPGQYFLFEIENESVIILRDDDGQVRALHNVCRHRGSQLCTVQTGQVKRLVCPYHQWVYDKDGTLLAAKFMPDDFDKSAFGLKPVHCRTIEGFIFMCFAENPPDFAPLKAAYGPHLQPYEMERTKVCHIRRYQVKSNWKLIAENFRECYHCTVGHPEYCKVIIGSNQNESWQKYQASYAESEKRWEAMGLHTKNVHFEDTDWHYCYRYPYHEGYETMSMDGKPVAPRLGSLPEGDVGVWSIVQYPNFWMDANNDSIFSMRLTPVSATVTDIELLWLVHEDAVEGVDYNVDRVTEFWRITGEQDWKLCEDNMAGVLSRAYEPGPYAPGEGGPGQFDNWYLKELARE